MIGRLIEDFAELNANPEIERQGFGVKRGDKIYLHPIEAFYLQMKGKAFFAEIEELKKWVEEKVESFSEFYFVYEDLRSRGYKPKFENEFLFAKRIFYPISEKNIIKLDKLLMVLRKFSEIILAIVDEESEVTYYLVSEIELQGEQVENLPRIQGRILKDRVITENVEIFRKYFYGSEVGGKVVLSLIESLYLLEKGSLTLDSAEKLYEVIKGINDFDEKYRVYRDLKRRGFVVKTGFKFGSDFRIYRKVDSVEDLPHSEFLVWIVNSDLTPRELARAVRLSNSVRKKLILAYKSAYILFDRVKV